MIATAVHEMGDGAVAWAIETASRLVVRLRATGDDIGVPHGGTGHEFEGSEKGLLTALTMMHRGRFDPVAIKTETMLRVARIAFRHGMPIQALTHKIWASHTASQDELLVAVETLVPPGEQIKIIHEMNAIMFDYGNAYVHALCEAYEDEARSWRGRLPDERRRVLLDVAAGAEPPTDSEEVLGSSLTGGHLHALVWSGSSSYIKDRDEIINDWGHAVAERLGASRLVPFQQESMTQIWWSFAGEAPATPAGLIREVPRPGWLRVALGPAGTGLAGFRDSHHGAALAAKVGHAADAGDLWEYDEVALLGLAIAEAAQAARFARRVLGPLLGPGERLAELRETVRLYLERGNSRVAVAKAMHVAPTTVAYRVAQVGELIGEPVSARPLEVRLSLELARHFPALLGLAD